jgi:predicted TPR repeat methyltransferase
MSSSGSAPSAAHAEAVKHHRAGDLAAAAACYRAAFAETRDALTASCLAVLLLSSPSHSDTVGGGKAEALALATFALESSASAPPARAAVLLSRVGYFYLLESGALGQSGVGAVHGNATLVQALDVLERSVTLDPLLVVAWRNLASAFRFAGRLEEAENAIRLAVKAAEQGGKAPASLRYSHAKALRRLRRFSEAAAVLCDALDADPGHDLARFCLQVTILNCDSALIVPLRDRISRHLAEKGGEIGAAPPGAVIPLDYVRRLFDGYASKFEGHLTTQLEYRTPTALKDLAMLGASMRGCSSPRWNRCADLGCGTGLMGPLFREYVHGELYGVDLSPAMVEEARTIRGDVYDHLAVADVDVWLRQRSAKASLDIGLANESSQLFDLILCADVLVYIPDLRPLFEAVALCMEPTSSCRDRKLSHVMRRPLERPELDVSAHCAAADMTCAPSLFVCSTEADLSGAEPLAEWTQPPAVVASSTVSDFLTRALPMPVADLQVPAFVPVPSHTSATSTGPGYRLLPSGRCCHKRDYVVSTAAAAGLSLLMEARRPIRKNAGVDVIGDLFVFEKY